MPVRKGTDMPALIIMLSHLPESVPGPPSRILVIIICG